LIPNLEILQPACGGRFLAQTRFGRLRDWAAGFVLALVGSLAVAQTPTAEQIEMFRNLSPDQQQAILEAISGGGGRSSALGTTSSADQRFEIPQTVLPRASGDQEERDRRTEADPRLETGDTLIVELELLEFEEDDRVLTERPPRDMTMLPGTQPIVVTGERANGDATGGTPKNATPPPGARTPVQRTTPQTEILERFIETVRRANPYRLDRNGAIDLPGLGVVPLAGLTVLQATQRLAIEPFLRDFRIRLTLLPLEPVDRDALEPFGYDLFKGAPTTFAPVSDVPVPAEYVIGPGDRFEVQLTGNTRGRHSLVVNRDGRVMFPDLGPIAVSGLRIDEARERIEGRVAEQMIGTQATVTMGALRTIRVFVLGEARRPGSYTVSGLATVTNALFVSGGVEEIGSLRNIELKRNGRVVSRIDLYDLLLRGDTSGDSRLQPGDVIFIPPVGTTVGVTGEVRRPAIYELKGESTTGDLVALAGGLSPEADARLATLERIDDQRDRIVVDVDLSDPAARETRLRSGDLLRVPGVRPTYSNSVRIDGHVLRPGSVQYRPGLRLSDVIPSADDLKPNADQRYVLIRRESAGTRRIEVLSADLTEAWRAPRSNLDPALSARDRIYVFDLATGRRAILDPILEDLRLQAVSAQPSQVVRISGRVRVPGEYPLEPGMTVSDLIRAGGGLAEEAYGGEADLARYEVRDGESRKTDVVKVNLGRALAQEPGSDLPLAPFDFLIVKEISEWSSQATVLLEGEVRFPGQYAVERGETLRQVIDRAGGLTTLAFGGGSVFTRETLRERERLQIERLATRLKRDLGSLALQGAQGSGMGAQQASETLAIGQSLLSDLRDTQPVGRLVIDLDRILAAAPGSPADVILQDGDVLRVPKMAQEVTVIGEVQNATSHLYDPSLDRDGYIRLSGGTTQKADDGRIYVVRANGSVETGSGSGWFRSSGGIQPGDTIVVPLDAERMRPLVLWQAVTTILYNIAIAVAAVNSF
jgi:polysaccharide export outer membrane protein